MAVLHWWIFGHIMSVVVFLFVHGVSIFLAFAIRYERDRVRLRILLDLSRYSVGVIHLSLFLVLITGIVVTSIGGYWDQGWLWTSLVLLVGVWGIMYVFGTRRTDRIRAAVGSPLFYPSKKNPNPPTLSDAELDRLLHSLRPYVLSVVGFVAIALFIWLMRMKPF